MSALNLTNATNILDNTTHCISSSPFTPLNKTATEGATEIRIVSLSSFEIILIAACSSFLILIFAALFNFLKLNIKQQKSAWRAPSKPDFDKLIEESKQCYLKQDQKQLSRAHANNLLHSSSFPPQNRYYEVTSSAYAIFVDAIAGTERDGWIYQGVKKGVRRYKKDIDSSPFSLFRGEKILNFAPHVLLHAVRDREIRLMIGDGQMKDCGALEMIDENCKIEFEEYRSPAPFVGAREFVYVDTIHRLGDGTLISFGRSVLHPARPMSDKFTRAQLKIGGWALMPIADEAEKSKVVYLVRADLGGSLPIWLLNQITSDIPMTVERLNVSLSSLSAKELERFDSPLMDVLLYGPREVEAMDTVQQEEMNEYPEANESTKQRFAEVIQRHGSLWSSDAYLDLIPSEDTEWVRRQPILVNGTVEEHEALLDRFVVPDKAFKYKRDVEEAFALFDTWRKWENGREWKEKAQKEDFKIYSHHVPQAAVDIIKGEAIIPFTVPVICGVLLNPYHRRKWDTKLDEVRRVGKASENTSIIYDCDYMVLCVCGWPNVAGLSSDLHKPGVLHIPPFPFKSLQIDIGWMDLEADNALFDVELKKRNTIKQDIP
eukprot:677630_1